MLGHALQLVRNVIFIWKNSLLSAKLIYPPSTKGQNLLVLADTHQNSNLLSPAQPPLSPHTLATSTQVPAANLVNTGPSSNSTFPEERPQMRT